MPKQRQVLGFSVIELLVVVAILAILVAIMIPIINSARNHARAVKCASHMSSWGKLIYQHATTHEGELPKLASAGESLYSAGGAIKAFFTANRLNPKIAYCPSNQPVYASCGGEHWGDIEWSQLGIDFASPLVLIDNTTDNVPASAPIPDILIDNITSGTDDYFEITGPASTATDTLPGGYYGTDYHWIECLDAAAGGGTIEVIVDNEDTGTDNYFTFTGDANTAESTYAPGYHATNYRWFVGEDPTAETELFVIDNVDTGTDNYFELTGVSSNAESSYVPGYYNSNYRWIICEGAAATATAIWHFKVPTPAGKVDGQEITLRLQGQWPKSAVYCVSDASFKVVHARGDSQVTFNQQTVGGDWVDIGTYTFKCGESYSVELDNSSGNISGDQKHVYADAIRAMYTSGGTTTAVWHFKVPDPGGMAGQTVDMVIDGKWPASAAYALKDVTFVVYHENGSTSFTVDQQQVGGDWHNFGTFTGKYGSSYQVEMGIATSQLGVPDAAKNINAYADAIRVTIEGTGEPITLATWHFKIPTPAGRADGDSVDLKVEGKWPPSASGCVKDASFTIYHKNGSSPVTLDQQSIGVDWYTLGTFSFACGQSYRVELGNRSEFLADPGPTNTRVHADAIRITDPTNTGSDGLPDSGFAVLTGGWTNSTWNDTAYPTSDPGYMHATPTSTDPAAAVWVFKAPAGEHTVYGWWPKETSFDHATGVPFTIHRRSDGGVIASASMSQKQGGEWLPIATCNFVGGEDYYVKVTANAASGDYVFADAIVIPKAGEGEYSADVFGYLYLGYRANLPAPPMGAVEPPEPLSMVRNMQTVESPSTTPILVDWLSDTPAFRSHGDYAHVLTLGGGVHKVYFTEAQHRWTNEHGTKFYW